MNGKLELIGIVVLIVCGVLWLLDDESNKAREGEAFCRSLGFAGGARFACFDGSSFCEVNYFGGKPYIEGGCFVEVKGK